MCNLRNILKRSQHCIKTVPAFVQGGIRGGLEIYLEFALIEVGHERRFEREEYNDASDESSGSQAKDCLTVVQYPAYNLAVTLHNCLEEIVKAVETSRYEPASSLSED